MADPVRRRGLALRVRITIASAAAIAMILLALGAFLYSRLRVELLRAVDLGLRARAGAVAAGIGQHGLNFADAPDTGGVSAAQILDPHGTLVESTGTRTPLVTPDALTQLGGGSFLGRGEGSPPAPWRLYVLPVNEGTQLYVVVGSSLVGVNQVLGRFLLLLVVGGFGALVLASVASWLLARAALRPVDRMRAEAEAISIDRPDRRLPVPDTNDEIARLGETLNSMLDRLQVALDAERRLLDDASHELRTPLAILKGELDLALSRARTPQELKATLQTASEETDHVTRLAEDLLVLSRAKQGRLEIRREAVVLSSSIERLCTTHLANAQQHGARIVWDVPGARVWVDPMRLRQALDNLLDNAVRHTPPGGEVRVEGEVSERTIRISVQDPGRGFPPSVLPTAFEPFVRADPDSDPPHEGAGLGLAIVRAVAEAHGGGATAENLHPCGARVSMILLDRPPER